MYLTKETHRETNGFDTAISTAENFSVNDNAILLRYQKSRTLRFSFPIASRVAVDDMIRKKDTVNPSATLRVGVGKMVGSARKAARSRCISSVMRSIRITSLNGGLVRWHAKVRRVQCFDTGASRKSRYRHCGDFRPGDVKYAVRRV